MMQTQVLSPTRGLFLTALVAVSLAGSLPALAKDKNVTDAAASIAAIEAKKAADAQSLGNLSPDPSLAMANASSSAIDPLANFGPSSGTVVGNRATELRDQILRLRASVNLNSNQFATLRSAGAAGAVQYHSTVAAITARLQNGTTRGNPILLRQWDEASASLDEVNTSLTRLNALQTTVESDASMASYLLESVQAAFQLSGAVDEDHDQLKLLRDEVSRLVVQLDYLRNQTTNDIQRQTSYLTTERSNLQTLSFAVNRGEIIGNSLANRPVIVNPSPVAALPQQSAAPNYTAPVPQAAPTAPVAPAGDVGIAPSIGRLLVLIRYNQPNVAYEQQLNRAVGTALERRPGAEFSVVAVSPTNGDPSELAKAQADARNNAEAVKRSLIQMGLAPAKINMATTQVQGAQSPEVHVYIR